jgi:hypothetical protein
MWLPCHCPCCPAIIAAINVVALPLPLLQEGYTAIGEKLLADFSLQNSKKTIAQFPKMAQTQSYHFLPHDGFSPLLGQKSLAATQRHSSSGSLVAAWRWLQLGGGSSGSSRSGCSGAVGQR